MAFNELEQKRHEKALTAFMAKHRPPPHVRAKLDLGYRFTGLSVELFEIRPKWDQPEVIHESPFAKATFVKTQDIWKVFWHRADMKWHRYDPTPEVKSLEEFLKVVGEDAHACFFG